MAILPAKLSPGRFCIDSVSFLAQHRFHNNTPNNNQSKYIHVEKDISLKIICQAEDNYVILFFKIRYEEVAVCIH